MSHLKADLKQETYQGELLFDEPLSFYTSLRVGGRAKKLYKPRDLADLSCFLKSLPPQEKILWLGLGSNVLIRDTGFDGTVILTQGKLNTLSVLEDGLVYAEAGVSCARMARFSARNHLAGAEFLAGIPGTIGGALRMNAGCHGGETWDTVDSVCTINRRGEIQQRSKDCYNIAYRHVSGLEDEWFVSARFKLPAGDKDTALKTIKNLLEHRSRTQPTGELNCGSVFRNPPDNFAASLIESCGLKGYKIGHALVSPKHANFIINQGGQATATDIEHLIVHIQNTVNDRQAIQLTQEVHIIGELNADKD